MKIFNKIYKDINSIRNKILSPSYKSYSKSFNLKKKELVFPILILESKYRMYLI